MVEIQVFNPTVLKTESRDSIWQFDSFPININQEALLNINPQQESLSLTLLNNQRRLQRTLTLTLTLDIVNNIYNSVSV